MNEICTFKLSKLFAGIELTETMKEELVGTVIKDEEGKEVGKVIGINMRDDIAWCKLLDSDLAEKMRENYGVSVEIIKE